MDNLSRLTLGDCRAIRVLAQQRHFGRAAAACGFSQPTLSGLVRKVETALGARLFERTGRRFLITEAGQRLLPVIGDLLATAERMSEIAGGLHPAPLTGEFRLGILPTIGPYLMPFVLGGLREAYPLLRLDIREELTAGLLDALKGGQLHAAIIATPVREAGLRALTLFDEPFVLIAPRGHELLTRRRLAATDLRACEMVLLEEGHCARDHMLAVCDKRQGARPRVVAASLEVLKYLVASGNGYSLMPALAATRESRLEPLIEYRRFEPPTPRRRIVLVHRRQAACRADVDAFFAYLTLQFRALPDMTGTGSARPPA